MIRAAVFALCMSLVISVSGLLSVSFAMDNRLENERVGDLPENREGITPYTDGRLPSDQARDGDLMPEPDTDPDSGVIEGDPDKDDGKPDDDANIGDSDDKNDAADKENGSDKDEKDEKSEKKFSYTGLIVALIIAVAVIILLAIMIPMSKKDPQHK